MLKFYVYFIKKTGTINQRVDFKGSVLMKKQLIIGLISMLSATYSFADNDNDEGGSVQKTSAIVLPGIPSPESIDILINGTPRQ